MSSSRILQKLNNTAGDTVPVEISSTAKLVSIGKELFKNGGWPGKRTKPLYKGDEKRRLFITEEDLRNAKFSTPAIPLNLAVREGYFNRILKEYIKKHGYQQILILGSGLDTRAHKKSQAKQLNKKNSELYAKVKFYEIDRHSILDAKEKRFQELNLDKNAEYIRADYTIDDFLGMLKDKGMDFSLPTLIIWEGNTIYLEKYKIEKMFQDLKSAFQLFTITFSHVSRDFIEGKPAKNSQLIFSSQFTPLFKTGFNPVDIEELARNYDMDVVSIVSIDKIRADQEVDEDYEERSEYFISTMCKK